MRSLSRLLVVLLSSAAGLGIASSLALADTFTLKLSLPSAATIDKTITVTASGNDPTDAGALYLEIDAIPTTLATTCPAGYLNGSQLASSSSSGALVAFDEPEDFDASGNFSNVNGYTPDATGQFLLCGYTDDGAGDTLATESMTTNVVAARPPVLKPVNTRKPRVTRNGDTLDCNVGRWTNAPRNYSYRWFLASKVKRGARGRTLGSARRLRGRLVRCSVTASNSAGAATATSAAFTVR